LAILDVGLRAWWHPQPSRLPEQFSAAYLDRYIDRYRDRDPIVVLGDSALWGYHLAAPDAAVAQLARVRPGDPILNLSYEGGSIVNSLVVLRLVLARDVHPRAVVINLNSKEFNPADSAYKRLQPAVERASAALLTAADHRMLTTLPPPTLADRLDEIVARAWALYRYRVDIRVGLFGVDDFAGLVTNGVHLITGEQRRYDRIHRVTADAFLGTYDLDPLPPDNVEMVYLRALRDELSQRRIPTIAFLTPTNHRLLADILDESYDENLARITALARGPAIRVVDLDRLPVGPHFLDNDHLDAVGSRVLAQRLAAELAALPR
jgi:lysophospholipase L1-like esterase